MWRTVTPPPRSPLPPGRIVVDWATIDLPPTVLEAMRRDLDDRERTRIDLLAAPDDRRRATVAHALMRRRVAAWLGCRPDAVPVVRRCAVCGSAAHGKPEIAAPGAPEIGLAHAGGVALAAISTAGPVGVDVEPAGREIDWHTMRRHVFSNDEWDETARSAAPQDMRLRAWTRKEAAAKATGLGLSAGLERVGIVPDADPAGWRAVTLPADVHTAAPLVVCDLAIGPGSVAAIAVIGSHPRPDLAVCPTDP